MPTGSASAERTPSTKRDVRSVIRDAIVEAFYAAHDGYSIDSCSSSPACKPPSTKPASNAASSAAQPIGTASSCGSAKRAVPKAGQDQEDHDSGEELEAYSFAAEIAWRLTSDKFGGSSLDEIFCDPEKAAFFDRTAYRHCPGFERGNTAGPRCGFAKPAAISSTK